MERLTKRLEDGQAVMDCAACGVSWHKKREKDIPYCTALFCRNRLKERLAAYEDFMDRWHLKSIEDAERIFRRVNDLGGTDLMAQYRELGSINHLHDLLQAEKSGQLVVLPCKVGDTVYVIDKGDYIHAFKPYVRPKTVREISWKATSRKDLGWGLILSGGDCGTSARYKLSSIGKTVFLTREDAEAALAGKGGDG